ncbi:hypothetical protein [Flavobacterium sp.]|uniref:hypothetical protein n=1 Tax=Flavobacterium sp. TaxID=239 RepID=UPI002B4B7628|nr:hypothetical protein [Flavobacterium sp.]HLP65696.1 hypothetical protein [Flavobacterium sp.]
MVPNKFEEQIREQLNAREIQPSENAWDRLDAMLSVAEEKKTKRSFGWLYIAASILVFVTAGLYFFNQNTSESTPDATIVNQEMTKDSVNDSLEKIQNEVPTENIQPLVQTEQNTTQPKTQNPQSTPTYNLQPTTNNRVSIIKSNQSIAQKSTPNPTKNTPSPKQEVIAQNNGKSEVKNPTPVFNTPTTIENKEVIAQNEVNQKPSTKVTVSANSLLSQVDGELELTFREKVLQKVSKNYKEVKVALSTRNTQE